MNFPIFVAKRYLFAKKSHNVINIISYISVVGVAIGTFALIVVLSIVNGYDDLVKSLYSAFDPDIRIEINEGKTFVPDSTLFAKVKQLQGVAGCSEVLEENALVSYQYDQSYNRTAPAQSIITMKGVADNYADFAGITHTQQMGTVLHSFITMGDFVLWRDSIPQTIIGAGVQQTLGINPNYATPLQIWIPKRGVKVSLTNPIDAMNTGFVYPSGIFSIEKNFDDNYIFVPIDFARNILNYTNEVSSIEVKLDSTENIENLQKQISEILGTQFSVKTRYQQNETLYKMLSSEKYAIYMILAFIIALFSFNIVGSVSMLIVDKKKDIATLKTLGADDKTVRRIFFYEGCMIAIGGAVIGLVLGIAVCLVQQYFKIIKLPNMFVIDAYPVKIMLGDIFMILAFVVLVGYTMARLPIWYLSKKMK